ncbi:hypothetical protein OIU34_17350 [Pararhizobium sp. BT-229]|uniref:hypothetical protein n=1 Tax=Pararhizobium sp. BT-229 TaxID=2986923 RepID=UPI0021F7E6DF|nr:hypothetical protein [Pararhizobium sp. BT-229]MCV9963669.1 hypothetical protein [Pararhizobium sp. BT-229]
MAGTKGRPIGAIELAFIYEPRIESDEARLFTAHRQVAKTGRASEFPLQIRAKLSAPMIPSDGGKATVATMDIDTTEMLLVHNWDELEHKITADIYDECGDSSTYHFYEFKHPEKFGHPGMVARGPKYHDSFKIGPDYIRNLVLEFAQGEFIRGVADLAARGRFDEEFDHLRRKIRADVNAAFYDIFYVVSHDGGFFVSRTNEPRLVLDKEWDDGNILLKLRHGAFDASSNWKYGVLSFPAELSQSAMSIREAVVTAETATSWMGLGPAELDDRLIKTGLPVQRDLGNFDSYRDSEFALYANAVSEMARAVIRHRGKTAFSPESVAACSWFAGIEPLAPDYPMDLIAPTWEGHLSDLCDALRSDEAAFSEFLSISDWPLQASPLTVMTAKFNKLAGRDMLHGLSDVSPKPSATTPGV